MHETSPVLSTLFQSKRNGRQHVGERVNSPQSARLAQMDPLIEADDLQQRHRRDSSGLDGAGDDDEALGRSYVCSLPSTIDLECSEEGNCAQLALNVQRYLTRIVEELHLISAWSSSVHQQRQQQLSAAASTRSDKAVDNTSLTAMARLAVVTDIELLRRDVAKAQHDLFQRCTTQMAHMQGEANAVISQQSTLYNEVLQRTSDSVSVSEQLSQSVQSLERARADSDTQIRTMATTLRHVQQQATAQQTKLAAIEKTVSDMAASQFSHEQELQTLQRRVESNESAHNLQMEATRRAAEDSVTGLRAANAQLSAKVQVLRLELQEHGEAQRRMQQLLKAIGSAAGASSGKPLITPSPGATPRRPSAAASGGRATASPNQGGSPGASSDSTKLVPTVMTTGAAAVATDCFIYAKAALPHRHSTIEASCSLKVPTPPQATNSGRASTGSHLAKPQDPMVALLKVQQSVMSVPLGFEDDPRPAPSTATHDNVETSDRATVTRHPTQRHSSLPDVNVCLAQGPKLQASRLHSRPQ